MLVSGGEQGGQVRVEDDTGFSAEPQLKPEGDGQVLQLTIPGTYNYRNVRLTALTPGIVFYGIRARNIQPSVPARFNFNSLPPL